MTELARLVGEVDSGYSSIKREDIHNWILEACSHATETPSTKHVRRVIMTMLRNKSLNPKMILDIVKRSNKWDNTPLMAAKALYLVLSVIQIRPNNNSMNDIALESQGIVRKLYCDDDEKMGYLIFARSMNEIIRSKGKIHYNRNNIHGNYSVPSSQKFTTELFQDMLIHFELVLTEVMKCFPYCESTRFLSYRVLFQPIIQELINVFEVVRAMDPNQIKCKDLCERSLTLFRSCSEMKFLSTSVIYPTDYISAPYNLFPEIQ